MLEFLLWVGGGVLIAIWVLIGFAVFLMALYLTVKVVTWAVLYTANEFRNDTKKGNCNE